MHTLFPSLQALSKKECIELLSLACQQDGDHIHMLQTTLNQSSMHASTYLESLLLETTLHHGKKLLIQACDNGLAVTVDTLLNALSDEGRLAVLSQEDHYGNTALMLAAQHGHTAIVQLLLKSLKDANADLPAAINQEDNHGNTALMWSSNNGHTEIVQLLIDTLQVANADLPAAINYAGFSGVTALMWAAQNGHAETAQLLLAGLPKQDRLAALNLTDNFGRTALMWAAQNGHAETVQLLLAGLPKQDRLAALNLTDNFGRTALMRAAQNGHAETVQRLLQHLQDDHVNLILLINKQNNYRESALTNAASNGQTQVVSRLLHALQAANAPMLDAICCGPGSRGDTALTAACSYGHIDIASLLLGALSESEQALLVMNHADIHGLTALGHAAASGRLELLKLLLDVLPHPKKAAAIKHADRDTHTPLCYAVAHIGQDTRIIQVLLDALPDEDRLTAINDPSIQPDKTVLMTVLNRIISIDPYTNTPVIVGGVDMMKFLLSYGPIISLAQRENIARIIAMHDVPYDLTSMPHDELLSFMREDGVDLNQNTLEQLLSWGIILGHQDFIKHVFPELSSTLSLETHTEFLRLALHAQKFEFAATLLETISGADENGQDNKQTVCNYLFYLMVIERGPISAIRLLRAHNAVFKTFTQADSAASHYRLLAKHSIFQENQLNTANGLFMCAHSVNNHLDNGMTMLHVACAQGNTDAVEAIVESLRYQQPAPSA